MELAETTKLPIKSVLKLEQLWSTLSDHKKREKHDSECQDCK